MINSLGITFSVWEKSNADGKGSGTYDWTSLIDSDKKKLLHLLPTQLESRDILFPETKETVIKIWRDFEGKWKPAPWCLAKIKGICQTLLLPWRKQSWVQQSTCNPYMHSHTMCQYSLITTHSNNSLDRVWKKTTMMQNVFFFSRSQISLSLN